MHMLKLLYNHDKNIIIVFLIIVMHLIPPFSSVLVATIMTPTASTTPTSGEATKIDCYYISNKFLSYVTFLWRKIYYVASLKR